MYSQLVQWLKFLKQSEVKYDNAVYFTPTTSNSRIVNIHCESKKLCHFLTAYNFRNIEQIFTNFGTNQSLFILNIAPEFI